MINLFQNINSDELKEMSSCLNFKEKIYKKKEIILLTGAVIQSIGIVIEGIVQITKEDENGNIVILTEITRGEIFGGADGKSGDQSCVAER